MSNDILHRVQQLEERVAALEAAMKVPNTTDFNESVIDTARRIIITVSKYYNVPVDAV